MILEPISDVVTCPGDRITFYCNVTMTRLRWIWQNATKSGIQEYAAIGGIEVNRTFDLENVPGVTTTLLNFGFNGSTAFFVASTLQFTPSDEFISANISCNNNWREVRITGTKDVLYNSYAFYEKQDIWHLL